MNFDGYDQYGRHGRSRNRMHNFTQLIQLVVSLQMLFGSRRGGTGALVLIIVLAAGGYFAFQFWFDPSRALATADRMWDTRDSAKRISAVREYKRLLRKPDPVEPGIPWLKNGRERLYRRIIEHEVLDREDNKEARDWILDAWRENIRELNFDTDEVRQMWQTVTGEQRGSGDSARSRNNGLIFDTNLF